MGDFGLDRDPQYQNKLWGNWFLTILSTFLTPCIELGYDWSKLSYTLYFLGWSGNDVGQIFGGLPAVWLFKPDAPYQRDQHGTPLLPVPTPYWYMMEPIRSTHFGWLPVEEVEKYYQRLLADWHFLEGDLRKQIELPPNVSVANAHISPDLNPDYWYERIPIVYQQVVEMMSQTLDRGVGLLSVVYQAYGDPEEWEQENAHDES
jgi:hypothetical protein